MPNNTISSDHRHYNEDQPASSGGEVYESYRVSSFKVKSTLNHVLCNTSEYNYSNGYCVWSCLIVPFHCIRVEWSLLKARQTETGRESHPSQHAMQCNWKLSKAQITWATLHTTDSPMQLWKVSRATGREGRTDVRRLVINCCPLNPKSGLSY